MKLMIEVEKDYYEMLKYNVEHGEKYKPFEIIANGVPYEERPQGEWIIDNDNLPVCKECGEVALQRVFVKMPHLIQEVRMVKSNFCPNCGADMRKPNCVTCDHFGDCDGCEKGEEE
jgi:hypothetical protein